MGTNYYHRTKICEHCHRYDERHIGKSSFGWTFGFHGYPELGLKSYKAWLDALEKDGEIFDEYGRSIPLVDFKKLVERLRLPLEAENNHTLFCRKKHPEHAEKHLWLDEEGYSFDSSDFS